MTTKITLIPGDGIGPEITDATLKIIEASGADIEFEEVYAGVTALEKYGDILPSATIDSIGKNSVALKGPLTTPLGGGFRSVNVQLRKIFDLYANVRPAKNFKGIKTPFDGVDLITVRENTEGLYTGIEYEVNKDVTQAVRVITRRATERVIRYAFDLAVSQGRKKVTVFHKSNIMKITDGLFTSVAEEVAKDYPDILCDYLIIDAACMKLVTDPQKFDVIVTSNLFGDIISDLTSGLIGGLGLTCGSNIGKDAAIFEAVHGSAPDIAGQNKANPTALLMAAVQMLYHINQPDAAVKIQTAVERTIEDGKYTTADIGGTATCSDYAKAVIDNM